MVSTLHSPGDPDNEELDANLLLGRFNALSNTQADIEEVRNKLRKGVNDIFSEDDVLFADVKHGLLPGDVTFSMGGPMLDNAELGTISSNEQMGNAIRHALDTTSTSTNTKILQLLKNVLDEHALVEDEDDINDDDDSDEGEDDTDTTEEGSGEGIVDAGAKNTDQRSSINTFMPGSIPFKNPLKEGDGKKISELKHETWSEKWGRSWTKKGLDWYNGLFEDKWGKYFNAFNSNFFLWRLFNPNRVKNDNK